MHPLGHSFKLATTMFAYNFCDKRQTKLFQNNKWESKTIESNQIKSKIGNTVLVNRNSSTFECFSKKLPEISILLKMIKIFIQN